jgi:hypothetical protein
MASLEEEPTMRTGFTIACALVAVLLAGGAAAGAWPITAKAFADTNVPLNGSEARPSSLTFIVPPV